MWTNVKIVGQEQKKKHKYILGRCKTMLENYTDTDDWSLPYKDGKIDVFKSISYIVSKNIGENPEHILSKNLTMKEVTYISGLVDRVKKDGIFRTGNTYVKQDKKEEISKTISFENSDDSEFSEISMSVQYGLGDNPLNVYFHNILMSYAMSKAPTMAHAMTEAIIMANINMEVGSASDMIVTPMFVQSSILMYWACKNSIIQKDSRGNYLGMPCFTKAIKGSDDFETFFKSYIGDEKVYGLLENYLTMLSSGQTSYKSFYNCIEDFVEISKTQLKTTNKLKPIVDDIEGQLASGFEDGSNSPPIKLTGKKNLRLMSIASVAFSSVGFGNIRIFPPEPAFLYILKQYYVNGKTNLFTPKQAETALDIAREHGLTCVKNAESISLSAVYWASPQIVGEFGNLEDELARAVQQANTAESKGSEYRKAMREAQKEAKQLSKQVASMQSTIDSLQKLSKSNIKEKDLESVKNQLASAQEKIRALQSEIDQQARALNKKESEIADIQDKLDKQEDDYLELLEKHDRLDKLNSELAVHREFNAVPIECFINAIKHKRIALIGGDMMHEKIRNYGMDNITLFKCGCRDITNEDLINKDLIVMATAFLDHASTGSVPRIAKQYGIPVIRFNNKNTEMLIYTLFEELNK